MSDSGMDGWGFGKDDVLKAYGECARGVHDLVREWGVEKACLHYSQMLSELAHQPGNPASDSWRDAFGGRVA